MGDRKRSKTERIMVTIPIRVLANGASCGGFTEDIDTILINRGGARISLRPRVVGQVVNIACPYTEGDRGPEQKAGVRRRSDFTAGSHWLYGFRYLR